MKLKASTLLGLGAAALTVGYIASKNNMSSKNTAQTNWMSNNENNMMNNNQANSISNNQSSLANNNAANANSVNTSNTGFNMSANENNTMNTNTNNKVNNDLTFNVNPGMTSHFSPATEGDMTKYHNFNLDNSQVDKIERWFGKSIQNISQTELNHELQALNHHIARCNKEIESIKGASTGYGTTSGIVSSNPETEKIKDQKGNYEEVKNCIMKLMKE